MCQTNGSFLKAKVIKQRNCESYTKKVPGPSSPFKLRLYLPARSRFSHGYDVKRKRNQLVQPRDALPTSYSLQDGLLTDSQSPSIRFPYCSTCSSTHMSFSSCDSNGAVAIHTHLTNLRIAPISPLF